MDQIGDSTIQGWSFRMAIPQLGSTGDGSNQIHWNFHQVQAETATVSDTRFALAALCSAGTLGKMEMVSEMLGVPS